MSAGSLRNSRRLDICVVRTPVVLGNRGDDTAIIRCGSVGSSCGAVVPLSIPASASPLKGLPAGKACAIAKYKGQVMLSRAMGGRFATAVSMGGLLCQAVDRRSVQRTTILRLLPRRSVSPSCVVLVYLNSSTLVTVSSMRNDRLHCGHKARLPRPQESVNTSSLHMRCWRPLRPSPRFVR